MLLTDSNYESISNLDYQNITCGSLNDIEIKDILKDPIIFKRK